MFVFVFVFVFLVYSLIVFINETALRRVIVENPSVTKSTACRVDLKCVS